MSNEATATTSVNSLLSSPLNKVDADAQGGVISPLLANLYLNALDWAVNHPQEQGRPALVRYADDFVILCAPGQGAELVGRLRRWLEARGLKLNEEKTRRVHSRDGFNFLGFSVRWQRSQVSGRCYAHIEPSAKSRQRLRNKVREQLNHWTLHRRIPEAVADLNKLLRGWGGYFHYRQSTRVFGKTQAWVRDRLRRWLWRKHNRTKALWDDYPNELLHDRYGLWRLPMRGYEFCHRGALEHSGRSCRTDGSGVTLRACWSANPQVGFREMLVDCIRSHSPFPLNEHRHKAPTWGPPHIPEYI